ncbi:DUF4340 domain-containing protein [Rubripirellula amarantea]|nr:DUF4340 domain-containing protein [Rubripirellula amarantea]
MSEATKTVSFWGIALVTIAMATFVAWPRATDTGSEELAGSMLFQEFKDPLAASSMKIVTFDEEQGQLGTFEIRKDRETGLWTIPSKDGYPADALEQMKVAANSLVGVKILDVQTENAEDHDDLGVIEPKLETLEVGDEGVGRLVTFKNDKQETLASLIIGDPVKDDETKRYVRIPNQDPVYVVKFDDGPLTTKFTDWIEDDLLQMSSIDIEQIEIKDYTAELGAGGIALVRNYTALVDQEGTKWSLNKLMEFNPKNPMAPPKEVQVAADKELNDTKLNELKNALDDLKIVGVFRKPEGVSSTLKASEDLTSNQDAVTSLAQRGFYPVSMGTDGEAEILSANGELSVSINNGVKYVLRFGNVAGIGDDGDSADEDEAGGVNRYLFVTTVVDEDKFPAPDLQAVPQTLEELDALLNPPEVEAPAADEMEEEEPLTGFEDSEESATEQEMEQQPATDNSDMTEEEPAADASAEGDASAEEPMTEDANTEEAGTEEASTEDTIVEEGETEVEGSGEAVGSGQAQDETAEESEETGDESTEDNESTEEADAPAIDASEPAESGDAAAKMTEDETAADDTQMTDEEKQERLEAEQEKITKSNQRLLDERKDRLKEAANRVAELNARFADWYYVIPETTYTQLRIQRNDLFKSEESVDAGTPPQGALQGGPQFNFGAPGN